METYLLAPSQITVACLFPVGKTKEYNLTQMNYRKLKHHWNMHKKEQIGASAINFKIAL